MAYLPVKLLGVINTTPVESTNRQIASYVLDNLEKIDFISAGSLAAACNVSKSSVSRFCRELDYEDFYHFQLDALRYTRNYFDKFKIEAEEGGTLTECYLERARQSIEQMKTRLDDGQVRQLAADLVSHPHVILMGNMQSGDIAYILQHNLFIAGKPATVAVNLREQRMLLQDIKSHTLVIIFSVSATFFHYLDMPDLLKERPEGVKLCLITTHPLETIPDVVDLAVNCGGDSTLAGGNMNMEHVANLLVLHYQKLTAGKPDKE